MRTDLDIFLSFTDAERRMFVLIGTCHLNYEIAEKEKLSVREVKIRMWRICERFMPPNEVDQVQSRYRLVCIWDELKRKVIVAEDGSVTMRSEELPAPEKVRKMPDTEKQEATPSETEASTKVHIDAPKTPAPALDISAYMGRVHAFGRIAPFQRRVAEAIALTSDIESAAAHYGKDKNAFYSYMNLLTSSLRLNSLSVPNRILVVRALYQEWQRLGAPVEVRKSARSRTFVHLGASTPKMAPASNAATSK